MTAAESVDRPGRADVIVVGAGLGGIYAVHRFCEQGLSVIGVEGAAGVGGVWFHNRYPGARVDLEGLWYCYHDPELYREWHWTERYPAQPELLAYLDWAAERWDVKRHFRFETWVTGARWDATRHGWAVSTDVGDELFGRFLVMATGPLTTARMPDLPGLDEFEGTWVRTAHWPDPPPALEGKRVGIVGTSASGVQAAPRLAEVAAHLTVFQRTAHYSAPAHNAMLSPERIEDHVRRAEALWEEVTAHPGGTDIPLPAGPGRSFTEAEQAAVLEERWAYGAHAMGSVFTDQGTDADVNEIVAEFVRDKIRARVKTPEVAERLLPRAYPIGTHRLAVDIDYYEMFNRENVTLVSLLESPIERVSATGVQLADGRHVDLDVLVLATGFHPITGALYGATLVGTGGVALADHWARGPMAYLGLMTRGFPNLFMPTGPGSPSVLANMFAGNEHHVDLAAAIVAHMDEHGYAQVEPSEEAEAWWAQENEAAAAPLLRYRVDNYMVHVNADDASRVFMPYPGGFDRFVRVCDEVVSAGFKGFEFS